MKQILTYISPDHKFNDEHQMAVKIQIDNSLSLGWDVEEIMLVTNFPYEYRGVEAIVIGDENYCQIHWPATKIYVLIKLFEMGLIGDDLYWYHDFDCFQLEPFSGNILLGADMGLTNYGRMPRLCSASIFFNKNAEDIFKRLKNEVEVSKKDEEMGIARMINRDEDLKGRVKLLNITYAFHKFNIVSCDKIVDKPIKVAHFHLTPDKYDFYVNGKNKLNRVLIPQGLINIFNKYGFNG